MTAKAGEPRWYRVKLLPTGDDGTSKEAASTGKLNQENEHIYNLWCSGRVCCEGMLIQLKVGRAVPRRPGCGLTPPL